MFGEGRVGDPYDYHGLPSGGPRNQKAIFDKILSTNPIYQNMKNTFSKVDINRNGKITRADFTSIFLSFRFGVQYEDINLLCDLYEDRATNLINYILFIEQLFPHESKIVLRFS
jgi:Ca2+-binding EF-hand superfamily protein